ncbi:MULTISPECIES: TetR/AcrR family transcriptional regulator [unclassified Aeromicrobium]|uniref:TetR/AcrR family transcriptional regulator n=1 Tax=unclassified Aeromicrobium TaxID=2633570 RepID=UPI002096859C|nr:MULTISPECIES: WHG domain-containing protein [unclassified Aeromicrobium]MCO7238172.1 WHG domain-containing protein [Aeromicrobium sp. CnD17-E]MDR6117895.1 AcrR family transcriptional regulator [Aeromicrobium sp. SORGH_AS_0981]
MPRAGLSTTAVLTAAADLADREGLDAVTPSAVARSVGVRTPSLYAHVAGAQALLDGVTTLALEELADRGTEALAGRSGRDALVALADAYRLYASQHPGRYAASRRGTDASARSVTAGRRHGDLLAAVLRGYPVPEGEIVHATRLVGAAVHGFVTLQASGAFDHSDPSADVSWHRVLDAVDVALRGWPGARSTDH